MSAAGTALLRACFLLLCLVAGTRQFEITEFVVPSATEIGDSAELRCQYELGPGGTDDAIYVKWWWTPESATSDDKKIIYQRIKGRPAGAVQHVLSSKIEIKDNDTIVLVEVTPADSGTFECEVFKDTSEQRNHSKLTAYYLGSGPALNISQIEDGTESEQPQLQIECRADLVAPKPEMSLSLNGKEINITTFVEDDDQDGLYNIYGNVTVVLEDTEAQEVRCEIFYLDSNITHPPYIDTKIFEIAGCDSQSTTEMPEDGTQPETSPESLQNYSGAGVKLHYSWLLLTSAALLVYLQIIL